MFDRGTIYIDNGYCLLHFLFRGDLYRRDESKARTCQAFPKAFHGLAYGQHVNV